MHGPLPSCKFVFLRSTAAPGKVELGIKISKTIVISNTCESLVPGPQRKATSADAQVSHKMVSDLHRTYDILLYTLSYL